MGEIWKYKLGHGKTEVEIPVGGLLLCAKTQNSEPHIWVLVSPEYNKETRTFAVYLTGQSVNFTNNAYIDTVVIDGGILHVFEVMGE